MTLTGTASGKTNATESPPQPGTTVTGMRPAPSQQLKVSGTDTASSMSTSAVSKSTTQLTVHPLTSMEPTTTATGTTPGAPTQRQTVRTRDGTTATGTILVPLIQSSQLVSIPSTSGSHATRTQLTARTKVVSTMTATPTTSAAPTRPGTIATGMAIVARHQSATSGTTCPGLATLAAQRQTTSHGQLVAATSARNVDPISLSAMTPPMAQELRPIAMQEPMESSLSS